MVFFEMGKEDGKLRFIRAIDIVDGDLKGMFEEYAGEERVPSDGEERSGQTEKDIVYKFRDFLKAQGAWSEETDGTQAAEIRVRCASFDQSRDLRVLLRDCGLKGHYAISGMKTVGEPWQDMVEVQKYAMACRFRLGAEKFGFEDVKKLFGITADGIFAVSEMYFKITDLWQRELTAEESETLCDTIISMPCEKVDLNGIEYGLATDMARLLVFAPDKFRQTMTYLARNCGKRDGTSWDRRYFVDRVGRAARKLYGERGGEMFEQNLPDAVGEVYPRELTYRILDGEGKIGANLIEIAYRQIRILVECGVELNPTAEGTALRERVVKSGDYNACFVTHYHADHAGIIADMDMSMRCIVYVGSRTKRVLESLCRRKFRNVVGQDGAKKFGGVTVTPFVCDHSALDSRMLLFEADGKSVLYTGDFRANGRKSFPALLERLPEKVDVLICDSTAMGKGENKSERQLEKEFREAFSATDGDVYVLTSATNFDRIVTVYKACRKCGKKLVVDGRQAEILNAAGGSIPHPRSHAGFIVEGGDASALADTAGGYVMLVRSSMGEICRNLLRVRTEATLVYSMWKGYEEKEAMKNFLDIFRNGGVRKEYIHTSGHADGNAVRRLVERVKPDEIHYVHGVNYES